MADDPQTRADEVLRLDPRLDSPGREGLTGTTRAGVYERALEWEDVTTAPDGAPPELQPRWRHDFPIDWPADQYVARRDFARFLVLTSGAFVAGQTWIAARHLIRANRPPPPRLRIAALADIRTREGYMAEYREAEDGEGWLLIENHCPICAAATACQGFCRSELAIFREMLGPECSIERTEHIVHGARRCAYRIRSEVD